MTTTRPPSDAAATPPDGATTAPDAVAPWVVQPMDAVAHLAIDSRGNLYLQDSLANELLMRPRQ